MYRFQSNTPARQIAPRPLLVPSETPPTAHRTKRRSPQPIPAPDCLSHRICRALQETGESETAFGRRVIGDQCLVRDLRFGRKPGSQTLARIYAALAVLEGR